MNGKAIPAADSEKYYHPTVEYSAGPLISAVERQCFRGRKQWKAVLSFLAGCAAYESISKYKK